MSGGGELREHGGAAAATTVPGPRGRLLVGTRYEYERDPATYLRQCRDTYGDIFALTPSHIVVCRPEWSQRILARTNREFQFRTGRLTRRESLMTDHVSRWMLARRGSAWHRLGHETVGEATRGIAERLRTAFRRAGSGAGVAYWQQTAADAALHVLICDIDPGLRRLVTEAAAAQVPVAESARLLPRWASPGMRRLARANDALVDRLRDAVDHRRTMSRRPPDILDVLLSIRDADGSGLDSTEIAQTLAVNLTNVYGVGGAALSWLLLVAARHPEAFHHRTDRLWADAVVKETLRRFPPIWTTGRQVLTAVELAGHRLEPGTSVLVSPLLMHSDPRWWRNDPAIFLPDRWLDPAQQPHEAHAYVPYGSGPRVCVGAALAQTLLVTAFQVLAAEWTVQIDSGSPQPRAAAVSIPDPFRVTLRPR